MLARLVISKIIGEIYVKPLGGEHLYVFVYSLFWNVFEFFKISI